MRQSSFRIWEGPSPYTGDRIHAIMTNLGRLSKNPKTGPMPQLWILSDIIPQEAIKMPHGDISVCGDCCLMPHTAKSWKESCYVARRAFQAPSNTWKGNIKRPIDLNGSLDAIRMLANPIRLGAYGDPGLLPQDLVDQIILTLRESKRYKTHTAYTHLQKHAFAYWSRRYAMASVENKWDGELFRTLGWRTFRQTDGPEAGTGEIICPNYTRGTQCIACCLCDGKRNKYDTRKSITIPKH